MNSDAAPEARYALNLILDEHRRLLMLKRTETSRLGAGLWGLPAGKIEQGETAEAAAWREMREEIGPRHEVRLERYIGPFRDTYYGGRFEIHLFQHRWLDGEITLNHEHTAHAWVDAEDFCDYPVMDGIDEDIAMLGFWPRRYLNADRIPPHLDEPP